jgi:hypothetical protein
MPELQPTAFFLPAALSFPSLLLLLPFLCARMLWLCVCVHLFPRRLTGLLSGSLVCPLLFALWLSRLCPLQLWNYSAVNTNERGDLWNGEDLSIFSRDQQSQHWKADLNSGGRALPAVVRPYAMKTAGVPLVSSFDMGRRHYLLAFKACPVLARRKVASEVFVAASVQYPEGFVVSANGVVLEPDRYQFDPVRQVLSVTSDAFRPPVAACPAARGVSAGVSAGGGVSGEDADVLEISTADKQLLNQLWWRGVRSVVTCIVSFCSAAVATDHILVRSAGTVSQQGRGTALQAGVFFTGIWAFSKGCNIAGLSRSWAMLLVLSPVRFSLAQRN